MPLPDRNRSTCYLVVDQGGHASRAVVLDGSGVILDQAERSLETHHPRDGFVEHDPDQLVRSIRESLEELTNRAESLINDVLCAGIVTQRSNVICWSRRTGEALSPVMSWQDIRGKSQIESLGCHADKIHEKTGLFPSAHYGATKLRWSLENIP